MNSLEQPKAPTGVLLHPVVSCTSFHKSKCPVKCEHSRPHEPIRDIYDEGIGYCHHLHGTCGYRSDQPKCICAANYKLTDRHAENQ